MKGKNLVILVILAAVLAVVAVSTSKKHITSSPAIIGKTIFPDLSIDSIEKIVVRSGNGQASVVRSDGGWIVPDHYDYQADFNKVKDCLLKLCDLKIGQVKELDMKQKAAMKLVPPPGSGSNTVSSTGTLVELRGKGDAVIAALLIGDARMKKSRGDMPEGFEGYPDGQYVSPDGGKSVYLVNTSLEDIPATSDKWLDGDIVSVMPSDISEISITGPGRKDILLKRTKDTTGLEVDALATNEVSLDGKMYSIESALSYFKLDDIADPAIKSDQSGLDKPVLFKAFTKNGEIYSVSLGKQKEGTDLRFCKVEVALKEAGKQPEPKDDNEKKKAEQDAKDRKSQEEKVKLMNDRLSKWTYLIAASKAENMIATRETLFEKKKEESKTTPEAKPE